MDRVVWGWKHHSIIEYLQRDEDDEDGIPWQIPKVTVEWNSVQWGNEEQPYSAVQDEEAIELYEEHVRFMVLAEHELAGEPPDVFDSHLNLEQINKVLRSSSPDSLR